ncbi:uncharacterized protein DDB_G0283357-like isoform X2 [Littorina saxatilis]|uniref:Chitin-binding type-2 domain-containing protein n=1 Tax=Littorina saxatilis TaxID=31220 RepID=A0AAN9AVR0_9CAEN
MYIFSFILRSFLWLVLAGYGLTQQSTQQSPFCPNANGDYPNPASETCASFFRCVQGRPLALRCPTGEAFDFLLRRCSPRDDVNCERQLQLFAAPAAGSSGGGTGANGLGSSFPFLNGDSDSNKFSFLNGLPQGLYDHLFSQSNANSQSNPQGQNGLNLQDLFGSGGSAQNQAPFGQGNLGQGQSPQAQGAGGIFAGVNGQGSGIRVTSDGQLTAGGKPIGKLYSSPHGTVIVIKKPQVQQAAAVPNIQTLNTVPVTPQDQPQQGTPQLATPSNIPAANQQGQNAQSQDPRANQVQPDGYANQGSQQSVTEILRQALSQGLGPISPGIPSFVNNLNQVDSKSVDIGSGSDSNGSDNSVSDSDVIDTDAS